MGDFPGLAVNVPGVAIVGMPHPAMRSVLSPDALEFTAMLARCGLLSCRLDHMHAFLRMSRRSVPTAPRLRREPVALLHPVLALCCACSPVAAATDRALPAASCMKPPAPMGNTRSNHPTDAAVLHRCSKHTDTVHELLARRRTVQARFDAGQKPHFLPHTRKACLAAAAVLGIRTLTTCCLQCAANAACRWDAAGSLHSSI
jgi:hypothetical protein